jgi:hypothetical protein
MTRSDIDYFDAIADGFAYRPWGGWGKGTECL